MQLFRFKYCDVCEDFVVLLYNKNVIYGKTKCINPIFFMLNRFKAS